MAAANWTECKGWWRALGNTEPLLALPYRELQSVLLHFVLSAYVSDAERHTVRKGFAELDDDGLKRKPAVVDDLPQLNAVPVPDWWSDDDPVDWAELDGTGGGELS